ncbi:MAG TPA: DUF1588 domain-containing protein [Lacipirellulaceae bacterium]|nr:DUF1588 domain-containing protein [Lacipirellulaceae bacterium]
MMRAPAPHLLCTWLIALVGAGCSSAWGEDSAGGGAVASEPLGFAATQAALDRSCGDCHGAERGNEGGFGLGELALPGSLVERYDRWMRVESRLADGSMPPDYAEPLLPDERAALVAWVDSATREAIRARGEAAGPAMFRRMTRHEYSNTVRDLLNTHFDAGESLPQDLAGGEGFDNASETLTISPIHAEKYFAAATTALQYAASEAESRERILRHRPSASVSETDAARRNLLAFARRAFRRPTAAADVEPYLQLFEEARADGLDFDLAMIYALRGVLTSPRFLFLSEAAPADPGPDAAVVDAPLDSWELATRLSYFLWASLPDRELREAADAGLLADPSELERQTLRMLKHPTALNDSMAQFAGQWLGTADLGQSKVIDRSRHAWINEPHVAAMRSQPVRFVESLLRENGSVLELIDSEWTFLNSDLVEIYGLEARRIDGKIGQHLLRVKLPAEYRRHGGVLGMGAVMAVTAYPRRTSPVLRGVWVLEKLLGSKSPPPPPNVPPLDEGPADDGPQTVRQRLENHRADPACAACHDRIDPVGFALENFDELGRWRTADDGGAIDARAQMPGGESFEGPEGLKQHLLAHKTQVARNLTEKMLGYALARGLTPSDRATVEAIVDRLEANDYRAQELVLGIVTSKPFRFKGISR